MEDAGTDRGRKRSAPVWSLNGHDLRRHSAIGYDQVSGSARLSAGSGNVSPVENDLSGLAGDHRIESLLEIAVAKAVRDDGRDVDARFEHHAHLVPGLVHFASIDAF